MELVDAADVPVRPRLRELHREGVDHGDLLADLVAEHDPGVEVAPSLVLFHGRARCAGRDDEGRCEDEFARPAVRPRDDVHNLVKIRGKRYGVWVVSVPVHSPCHGVARSNLDGAWKELVERASPPRPSDQDGQVAWSELAYLLLFRVAAGNDQRRHQRYQCKQMLHSGNPILNTRR